MSGAIALAPSAQAQGLIRDAEIERTLSLIADPILRAAALNPRTVNIRIINNPRMNAFVAGGNNIYIHTGLLRRLKSIEQVSAVLAHETGHIAGGHLVRRDAQLRNSKGIAGLGLLLAVAVAVAGDRRVGAATGLLSQEAALRSFLSHTRSEEASADQAGLRFLVGAGVDPQGMIEVLKMFSGQELLSSSRADPYVMTHPLWSQRLRYIEDRIASAPRGKPASATDAYWHARMVAKFNGFIGSPRQTLRKYKDDKSEYGLLARAVAYHRYPDIRRSMQAVDALIRARPRDQFYRELKGQFLIEDGKAAASVKAYREAVSLAPKEPLILAGLGRALIALDQPGATKEAQKVLERARSLDPAIAGVFRDLAVAYARNGQIGNASLATAERFALQGRLRDAQIHATRAVKRLPEGSAGWRQAQDIITVAKRALK